MSLRTWLLDRLRPMLGSADDNPSLLVELTTVAPHEATILRQVLHQHGVDSTESKALAPVTWDDRSCLLVRRSDLDTATRVLPQFRAG